MPTPNVEELKKKLEQQLPGQTHVLRYLEELPEAEQVALASQIRQIDVSHLNEAFHASLHTSLPQAGDVLQPPNDRYFVRDELSEEKREHYYDIGLKAIANGEVAAIVLAGGQASRLGASKPKGTLELGLGLNEHEDSLLMFQAAQLARLTVLAKSKFPEANPTITWVVMTSESTTNETASHLDSVIRKVGLPRENVLLFTQKQIPSFDMEGRFLMSSKAKLATSPDGNGGIYEAIKPLLPELTHRGLKYFHVYCVDNILAKVCDPHFIGCCIENGADCAAKVIEKREPTQAVGHVCIVNGHVKVVEYSEITPEMAERRDPINGKLYLRAGSIANHVFTLDFLRLVCENAKNLPFHVAKKKIEHIDVSGDGHLIRPSTPNGIKLEKFIFDAFYYSKSFLVWQVDEKKEFSPLKNADSVGKDCLTTCRQDLARNHRDWLEKAGLLPRDFQASMVFISPLVSYGGEGLDSNTVPLEHLKAGNKEEDGSKNVYPNSVVIKCSQAHNKSISKFNSTNGTAIEHSIIG